MDNHEELARELVDAWSSAYPEAEVWPGNDYGSTSGTEESDEVPEQPSTYLPQNYRTSTSSASLRSSDQGVAPSNTDLRNEVESDDYICVSVDVR
eukprot:scaffold25319_cov147-Cylindrotheca_fusiformis.AAC.1